jgi:hypothetical protein
MLFALLIACSSKAEIVEGAIITVHPDAGVVCYVYNGSISCIADPWVDVIVQPEADTGDVACGSQRP